jgi:phosphatidate phosphatase LPIN
MINGKLTEVCMKVGDAGEVFFVHESNGPINKNIVTSPLLDTSPKDDEEILFESEKDYIDIDLSQLDFTESPDEKAPTISILSPKEEEKKEEIKQEIQQEIKEEIKKENSWSWVWGGLPSWFGFQEENSVDIKKKNDFIEQEYLETLEKEYGAYKDDAKIINLRSLLEEHEEEVKVSPNNKPVEKKPSTPLQIVEKKSISPQEKVSPSPKISPSSKSPISPSPIKKVSVKRTTLDLKEDNLKQLVATLPPSMTPQTSPKPTPKIQNSESENVSNSSTGSSNSWKRWLVIDTEKEDELSFEKSVYPTNEQINSLGLKDGKNEIKFIVTSRVQGPQELVANIYLWDHKTKVVISDIDGTITRSDALGHILPMMGKDWSHSGIASLYTNIVKNGYKILYLTSRSILQAGATRGYIESVKQESHMLPEGPIITSPDKLMQCLTREVITKNPEEFKIAALRDVQKLFPRDPFYAGFGNKINVRFLRIHSKDFIAYRTVGVRDYRIFIIESTGILRVNSVLHKSYKDVNELVDMIFPDLNSKKSELSGYTNLNYWKLPIRNVASIEDLSELK